MKNRKGLLIAAVLLILAVIVFANRGRIHFDWSIFFQQLRLSWRNTQPICQWCQFLFLEQQSGQFQHCGEPNSYQRVQRYRHRCGRMLFDGDHFSAGFQPGAN